MSFRCRGLLALLAIFILPLTARAANEIVAGPMVGHTTDRSARVWMQLSTARQVAIRCFEVDSGREVSGVTVDIEGPSPFICDTPMSNLSPNKNYRIEVKLDGDLVKLPDPPLVIRTAPPAGEVAAFTVAFGSCVDLSQKGSTAIFKPITALQPRVFLFLGNNGYLPTKEDDYPRTRRAAFRTICDLHLAFKREPDLQPLFRSTTSYAIWDDHDFGPTASNRNWVYAKESQSAFQRYWANPDWGMPDNPGAYFSFSISDTDFYMLDARMYRDPDNDLARETMLGDKQLKWLEKSLLESRATFKVIATPNQAIADYHKYDSWAHFPEEQQALTKFIFDNKITGVMFISGNRHLGELTIKQPNDNPNAYPLVDLTSSPLGANPVSPEIEGLKNPDRSGDAVFENNFGTLDFGGPRDKRFVTLKLRDELGKTKLDQTIFASQLRGK